MHLSQNSPSYFNQTLLALQRDGSQLRHKGYTSSDLDTADLEARAAAPGTAAALSAAPGGWMALAGQVHGQGHAAAPAVAHKNRSGRPPRGEEYTPQQKKAAKKVYDVVCTASFRCLKVVSCVIRKCVAALVWVIVYIFSLATFFYRNFAKPTKFPRDGRSSSTKLRCSSWKLK